MTHPRITTQKLLNFNLGIDRRLHDRALAVAGLEDRTLANLLRHALRIYIEDVEAAHRDILGYPDAKPEPLAPPFDARAHEHAIADAWHDHPTLRTASGLE